MSEIIPILIYHSIAERCTPAYRRWNMHPDCFGRQMKFLSSEGFVPCTVAKLVSFRIAGVAPPAKTVVLTFDDGLRDFLTGAIPILEQYGFPATLFVVAGLLGKTSTWLAPLGEADRPMLSDRELRDVSGRGVEIGSHSMTHPQLDLLRTDQRLREVVLSKARLEDAIGSPVTSFAYPHGYSNEDTRRIVREAGFTAGCRARHALSTTAEDALTLSRIFVTEDLPDERFLRLLQGQGLPVAPPAETLAIRGWRLLRQMKQLAGDTT